MKTSCRATRKSPPFPFTADGFARSPSLSLSFPAYKERMLYYTGSSLAALVFMPRSWASFFGGGGGGSPMSGIRIVKGCMVRRDLGNALCLIAERWNKKGTEVYICGSNSFFGSNILETRPLNRFFSLSYLIIRNLKFRYLRWIMWFVFFFSCTP